MFHLMQSNRQSSVFVLNFPSKYMPANKIKVTMNKIFTIRLPLTIN